MHADVDDSLAVILAGGAGTRVGGTDKGLLPLCGRPLVEHVLDALRGQCGRIVISANRNLEVFARHAPTIHDGGAGHAGPLAGLIGVFGLLAANRQALPRWLLTVPVDCPALPRDLARRLHAALVADATECCAVARADGMPQPLIAMYRIDDDPESWRASARAALHVHGSPWRWQAAMEALLVDFDAGGGAFDNLNTPDDFRAWERAHGQ